VFHSASRRGHPRARVAACIVVLPNGMVSSYYRDAASGQLPMESVLSKT